jgi:hypothetical protein
MSMFALLLLAGSQAAPAPAPAPAPATGATPQAQAQAQALQPPPEFTTAASAFGQCIGQAASALPTTVAPEAGARQVMTGCATQKATLDQRFEAWVSSPTFPAAGREQARTQFRSQIDGVEAQLAGSIREARAKASAGAGAGAAPGTPAAGSAASPAASPSTAPAPGGR